jgi:hypothetical protein
MAALVHKVRVGDHFVCGLACVSLEIEPSERVLDCF